jgi:ubiquitin-small subunit ribosomal protein S27Ae
MADDKKKVEAPAEGAETEVQEEKKKVKRGKRPRSKNKHKIVQIWKLYKDGKAQREHCPRCGVGVFLAKHKDRVTCGKCGYMHQAGKSPKPVAVAAKK